MRWTLLIVGLLLGIGLIATALSKPDSYGSAVVSIEPDSEEPVIAVRGLSVSANFTLHNNTSSVVRVDGVRTGCGCAVLTSGTSELLGQTLAPRCRQSAVLKVDTTNRAMGDFSLPIELFLSDARGERYHLQTVQHIRVNPGWSTSKQRLTLDCNSDEDDIVADEFLLFQTSPDHPFEITEATLRHDRIDIHVEAVAPDGISDEMVVSKGDVSWNATPRYRIRVSSMSADIDNRETAQLVLQLSHGLTRVVMDMALIPAKKVLDIVPRQLALAANEAVTRHEFIVATDGPVDEVVVVVPAGVAVLEKLPIGKNALRVNVRIDRSEWDGEAIQVEDKRGHRQAVAIASP